MIINVTDSYKNDERLEIIDTNLALLASTPLPVMNTRGDMKGKLTTFLEYLRDHGSAFIYGKHYTGVAISTLREENKRKRGTKGSPSTWERYIHAWIEWDLLGAPDHSWSEKNIFEINAMDHARDNDQRNATTMYAVTRWTAEKLASLTAIKGTGTKADKIHRRGQAEANRIYGDQREISPAQRLAEEKILDRIDTEIRRKGYCTRGELRQRVHVTYTDRNGVDRRIKIDPVFEDMRAEIEKRYRYGAPTAEILRKLRDQYGADKIQINGRQWIITAK